MNGYKIYFVHEIFINKCWVINFINNLRKIAINLILNNYLTIPRIYKKNNYVTAPGSVNRKVIDKSIQQWR